MVLKPSYTPTRCSFSLSHFLSLLLSTYSLAGTYRPLILIGSFVSVKERCLKKHITHIVKNKGRGGLFWGLCVFLGFVFDLHLGSGIFKLLNDDIICDPGSQNQEHF